MALGPLDKVGAGVLTWFLSGVACSPVPSKSWCGYPNVCPVEPFSLEGLHSSQIGLANGRRARPPQHRKAELSLYHSRTTAPLDSSTRSSDEAACCYLVYHEHVAIQKQPIRLEPDSCTSAALPIGVVLRFCQMQS